MVWVQTGGGKFWAGVCAQLADRSVQDVLITCCGGLPEAIEATWPHAVVQICVVHLIRAANRYVSYDDRKAFSAALRRVYTTTDAAAAETALRELAESHWDASTRLRLPFGSARGSGPPRSSS